MRRTLAFVSMIAALLVSATAGRAADYAIDPTHSHICSRSTILDSQKWSAYLATSVETSASMPTTFLAVN